MPPKAQWSPEQDAVLLTAIVGAVLANRRNMYATPGLEDWAGNGGSRINQRIQQMLKRLCSDYGALGIVEGQVKTAGARPAAGTSGGNGAGGASGGGAKRTRKRKVQEIDVKDEVKDEIEEDDELDE